MKMRIIFAILLLVGSWAADATATATDNDVFILSEQLRHAILKSDIHYITNMDRQENLQHDQNKYFLLGNKSSKRKINSVRNILSNGNIVTLIQKNNIGTNSIYIIYWIIPVNGKIELKRSNWMVTFAACAVKKVDKQWIFISHVCYSETEGPF